MADSIDGLALPAIGAWGAGDVKLPRPNSDCGALFPLGIVVHYKHVIRAIKNGALFKAYRPVLVLHQSPSL